MTFEVIVISVVKFRFQLIGIFIGDRIFIDYHERFLVRYWWKKI